MNMHSDQAELWVQVEQAFDPDACLIDVRTGAPTVAGISHLPRAQAQKEDTVSTASTIQAPAQTIDQATLAVAVQESVAAGTPLLVAVENVAAANSISFDTVFAAVCTAVRVEKFGQ